MKALILAAGKSTRTLPLTASTPKPLLQVGSKPLIGHLLDNLIGIVKHAIIVVNGNIIQNALGSTYKSISLTYIYQKDQSGTANAVSSAKHLTGKFMVLMADDLYSKNDILACSKKQFCILAKKVNNVTNFGAIISDNGKLKKLVEKPSESISELANTGLYVIDDRIFKIISKIKLSKRKEYEFTDAINEFCQIEKMEIIVAGFWLPITYPWSLLDANEKILHDIKPDIYATVEKNVVIKGKVIVGKNSLLRSGTYIEGPVIIGENCDIGPNCYIRPHTQIGKNCRIGNAVEIKNSIIGNFSHIAHLSYVADSIIGNNCNLGAGFIVANLRHDNESVKSLVNGKLIDSHRRKLGTIIGDNVKTGIHTSVYPGRKIWANKTTLPGEIVTKDIV